MRNGCGGLAEALVCIYETESTLMNSFPLFPLSSFHCGILHNRTCILTRIIGLMPPGFFSLSFRTLFVSNRFNYLIVLMLLFNRLVSIHVFFCNLSIYRIPLLQGNCFDLQFLVVSPKNHLSQTLLALTRNRRAANLQYFPSNAPD